MADNINNSDVLETKPYMYRGFQRINSYDPNMCTTAAQFSPFYGRVNPTQTAVHNANRSKSLAYVKAPDENIVASKVSNDISRSSTSNKIQNSSYLPYSSEILIEEQNTNVEVFVENQIDESVAFPNKQQEQPAISAEHEHGFDFVQQTHQVESVINSEPITTEVVLHRSPNGHLYQDFYVTNENGVAEEIVELVPIDSGNRGHLEGINENGFSLQPFEFPGECNMETLDNRFQDEHQMNSVAEDEDRKRILAAQILEREQQRILLESTMSPLLAAVNDITQRDAELLSYLNQHVEKEKIAHNLPSHNDYRPELFKSNERESSDDDDYILVSDKPVQSRARATLPTNYLYFGAVQADTNEPSIFAKKAIPQRTKFGPFDGEVRFMSDICINILRSEHPRYYPLLLVGNSRVLVITSEENSNWMRFVRLAQMYSEQNLQIIEEDCRIYFKCNRDIKPKEELRVGYHSTYAVKYNLPTLKPSLEDNENKFKLENPWICFECDKRFPTSQEMQKHLEVHDVEDASCIISKRKIKRKRKKFKKLSDLPRNSSRCLICFKVFMTNASLKKHFSTHLAMKKSRAKVTLKAADRVHYRCQMCKKKFSSEEKLKSHQQTHLNATKNENKPYKCPQCEQHCATPTALAAHIRGHTNRLYSCVYCQQTYKYVMDFKKHVLQHCNDGVYTCFHCHKKYQAYHLVRKHIRIFHPAVKYPCNECDRLFLHLSFLRRHKAIHAKKTNFQCSQCEQRFANTEDLQHHAKTFHKSRRKLKKPKGPTELTESTQQTTWKEKKSEKSEKKKFCGTDEYLQFQFKCEDCKVGFKRRGMLVNHMVKRHPERNIDLIEDLNQPIVKLQTIFNCPHCPKIYKNNAKRKAHIIKNHPGLEIPPSFRSNPILSDVNVQTVGCIKTDVQRCQFCYKQYGSRTRLLSHYRKAHQNEKVPEIPVLDSPPSQILIEEQCADVEMNIYRPPISPENKLLKLSSAALELSSIEDRKYFDFLNERSETTEGNKNNYKIAASEFGETSSNTELNRLPELFDDSIACI